MHLELESWSKARNPSAAERWIEPGRSPNPTACLLESNHERMVKRRGRGLLAPLVVVVASIAGVLAAGEWGGVDSLNSIYCCCAGCLLHSSSLSLSPLVSFADEVCNKQTCYRACHPTLINALISVHAISAHALWASRGVALPWYYVLVVWWSRRLY